MERGRAPWSGAVEPGLALWSRAWRGSSPEREPERSGAGAPPAGPARPSRPRSHLPARSLPGILGNPGAVCPAGKQRRFIRKVKISPS